jgi:hypothetical protein
MQNIYPRTNPTPFAALKNSNAKPAPQIDALHDFARQDTAHLRREPENATQGVSRHEPEGKTQVLPDVNPLIQRVAGVSLSPLKNVISELQQLHDFLHNESERVQQEISDYLRLSQTAMGSTRIIADNIVLWKETANSTARAPENRSPATERADLVASAPPPSSATKDAFIPPK